MRELKEHPRHPGYISVRIVDQEDPEDDEAEYFYGLYVFSKQNPEFAIQEFVGDPGAYYGPYFIVKSIGGNWAEAIEGKEVTWGIVGQKDTLEEAKEHILTLAKNDVTPLPMIVPDFFEEESETITSVDGYKINSVINPLCHRGVNDYSISCTITRPDGSPAGGICVDSFQDVINLRDSSSYMKECLDQIDKFNKMQEKAELDYETESLVKQKKDDTWENDIPF